MAGPAERGGEEGATAPSGRVALVMRTRNDEDIVFQNLAWHFASGLRQFLVVDDASSDSTRAEIGRFARACEPLGARLVVVDGDDPGDISGQAMTAAAHAAQDHFGAEWIIALEPDEFLNLDKLDLLALTAGAEAEMERRLGVARTSPLFMAGLRLPIIDHLCSRMDRASESNPLARMAFRWRKPRPGFRVGSLQAARWSPDLAFGSRNQAQTAAGSPVPAFDAAVMGVQIRRFQVRSFDHFLKLAEDAARTPQTSPDPATSAADWTAWREALRLGGPEAVRGVYQERFELDPAEMVHDPLRGLVVRRDAVFIDHGPEGKRPVAHLPFKGRQLVAVGGRVYEAESILLHAPPAPRPVRLRLNTSDVPTFLQVFSREEYAIPFPAAPAYVMDLGANIGLAAAYFAGRFPGARIVCVEPDADNHRMLVANTADYPGVLALHAAVWPESGRLEVVRSKEDGAPLGAWGVRTRALASSATATAAQSDQVPALTIPEIMQRAGFPRIDLLKVDIEGAELELFSRNTDAWLGCVRYLVVETHDRFRPGSTAAVERAMQGLDFDQHRSGENLVFIRRAPAQASDRAPPQTVAIASD